MPQNLLIAQLGSDCAPNNFHSCRFIFKRRFSLLTACIIFLHIEELSQQSLHAFKDRPEEVMMLALKWYVMSECRSLAPNWVLLVGAVAKWWLEPGAGWWNWVPHPRHCTVHYTCTPLYTLWGAGIWNKVGIMAMLVSNWRLWCLHDNTQLSVNQDASNMIPWTERTDFQ